MNAHKKICNFFRSGGSCCFLLLGSRVKEIGISYVQATPIVIPESRYRGYRSFATIFGEVTKLFGYGMNIE